jgi:putative ABC transport system permease protein
MAWRNIWRNPTRSLVVITAIAIGIWAAIFLSGFATGMSKSYVNNAIANIISHIQIHHPKWEENYEVKYYLPDAAAKLASIRDRESIRAVSARTLVNGMISSPQGARGIRVKGVVPEDESAVSQLDKNVEEGEYFPGNNRNELLIGKELAEKLEVGLRSKVVLTFQDLEGEITAGAFRVVGLFDTGNLGFNEGYVFVHRDDLNRLLGAAPGTPPYIHEIAIMVRNPDDVTAVKEQLAQQFPDLEVQTYREISPDLELYESQIKTISIIYLTVIMLALIFGIINTMLMAVLERTRELGMLMAIGMNKVRVFFMIVLETILLSAVGAPIGLLIGYLTILYFGTNGINLSAFSETLKMYGLSQVIYFELEPVVYKQVPIAVALTAVLASIYPAWKAIRLNPVEAIRIVG